MGLLTTMKDWAVKLERMNDSLFTYPVEKQKSFINSFRAPRDDIERAYDQYKCQMKFNPAGIDVALNLASLPMIVGYLMKETARPKREQKYDAIFFADGKPENIIPDELRSQYKSWLTIEKKGEYLSPADRKYFKRIAKRYPASWQFLLKSLLKLQFYSYEIEKHHPKTIVVCNEYSFTSSLLSDYCKRRHIKHINVMHGEKLYYMRDSFFRFDECYVWDPYYAELLSSLRADRNQFRVAVPPSLKFDSSYTRSNKMDYTYYFGAEKDEALKRISEALKVMKQGGKRVAIRPHPRYSDISKMKTMFSFAEIEDTNKLTIEESLMRTGHAVAVYSTVLNQALCNSVPVVIDDISNPEHYKKLKELGYICLKKEHRRLSEVVEELGGSNVNI